MSQQQDLTENHSTTSTEPLCSDGDADQSAVPLSVADDEKKWRLDKFLARRLPHLSRSRLQALIGAGQVVVDGAVVDNANHRLKPAQVICLTLPPAQEAAPVAQKIPLDLVFEDAHLLVVNKPPGLVVHPAPGNPDRTLVNALLYHCGDSLPGIGGIKRPGIVHRLDKDTSGLMVVAKTQQCHQGLATLFARHDIERYYHALVWGVPRPCAGTVTGAIGRNPGNRKKMAVVATGGKPAVTHYKVLQSLARGTVAHLECWLETGRTHQIRVHMTHQGTPLLADPVYGNQSVARQKFLSDAAKAQMAQFHRQALHAKTLGFVHPITGVKHFFDSSLADDLQNLLETL